MNDTPTSRPSPARPPTGGQPASPASPVGLPALVRVELRKITDTRAGYWLLNIGVLASFVVSTVAHHQLPEVDRTFRTFLEIAQLVPLLLLPVLGVLSMTEEWSQRTALTTFALVPQRSRVLAAKLVTALLVAIGGAVFAAALATVTTFRGGGVWDVEPVVLAQTVLLQVLAVLAGSALGALLQSTPLAIACYLLVPVGWALLAGIGPGVDAVAAWWDLDRTTAALTSPEVTGEQWAQLGVSALAWVVAPMVAGWFRAVHRDVG